MSLIEYNYLRLCIRAYNDGTRNSTRQEISADTIVVLRTESYFVAILGKRLLFWKQTINGIKIEQKLLNSPPKDDFGDNSYGTEYLPTYCITANRLINKNNVIKHT